MFRLLGALRRSLPLAAAAVSSHPPPAPFPEGKARSAADDGEGPPQRLSEAMLLKQHCNYVLSKFTPPPPEVFVHRAEAYMALGQPYFALADFIVARERSDQIGRQPQDSCLRECEKLPAEMLLTVPSASSHVGLHVAPFLSRKVALKYIDPMVGRGIFAQFAIAKGETLVTRRLPFAQYPLQEGHCSCCGRTITTRSIPCSNRDCHEEYCSRDCRQAALESYHKPLCNNAAVQAMELDVYARYKSPTANGSDRAQAALILLLLRVVGCSLKDRCVPSALPQLRLLSGRLVCSPTILATSMLDAYRRLVTATKTESTVSYEEVVGAMARLSANAFQTESSILINVPRSMLNHSCRPNAWEHSATGDVVALRNIDAGEEVTFSYYPQVTYASGRRLGDGTDETAGFAPFDVRHAQLRLRNFDCRCSACAQHL